MKIPQLRKQPEKKSCHGYSWIDEYSWIHQNNCLEILRDTSKLNPEVKKYLEEENNFTNLIKLLNERNLHIHGYTIEDILVSKKDTIFYICDHDQNCI